MRRIILFIIFSFFVACSDNSEVAGGTEAESTIALHVQFAHAPASYTRVRALPNEYLPDGLNASEWQKTDENGFIKITAKAGVYTIEARNVNDTLATGAILIKSLNAGEKITTDTLSLEKLTKIEGKVMPGQGPSVVRIAGLERFIVPDSAGNFTIDSLPIGNFDIFIESRSNRGSITLQATSGDTIPEISLGVPKGFAVENFESFSGVSNTGAILGYGWWYTLDATGENIMPLWDSTLTYKYSGSIGCASGGCARTTERLGFLLGAYGVDYALPDLKTLMFSAKGNGTLKVKLAHGEFKNSATCETNSEGGLEYEITLSKVWQGYSILVSDMKPYGCASQKESSLVVNRIDFNVSKNDTLFIDDVFLGGVNEASFSSVATRALDSTEYPKNWEAHEALLKNIEGYAKGTMGAMGVTDSLGNINSANESSRKICEVTTTDDFTIVEDSTNVDSIGNVSTSAIAAKGSLRECASIDGPVWIIFKNSGTYNLQSPLRLKSDKTIDGRGRNIRITGMGILTNNSSNLIFENLTFSSPAITVLDVSSRRALSVHNLSHHVWVDHCVFEEYPLIELDIKRGSQNVTVSWSRFENAQTGILFGLSPDKYKDSLQLFTMHNNYFANMENSGILAHGGFMHAYNNFFKDVGYFGIECTDSAKCYVEKNIFNVKNSVSLYSAYDSLGVPVDSTIGFVKMLDNWFVAGGKNLNGDALGLKPNYEYNAFEANADLAWKVDKFSGCR